MSLVEKEKEELLAFKASITSTQQNLVQNDYYSEFLVKSMSDLKLKEAKNQSLKANTVHKDRKITSSKKTVAQMDHDVK